MVTEPPEFSPFPNGIRSMQCPPRAISFSGWCIATSIVFCALEGAARKWLFPDSSLVGQALCYFAKDVPLGLAVLWSLGTGSVSEWVLSFRRSLVLGTILIGVGSLLSLTGATLIGGVLTTRALILLPWAAVLITPTLRGRGDLPLICHLIGLLAVGNAMLGGLQSILPDSHFLNRQVQSSIQATVALEGTRVRASGTFSFITGIADLGIVGSWAGAVLILRHPFRPWGYVYGFAALFAAASGLSRTGVIGAAVILGMCGLTAPRQVRRYLLLGLVVFGALVLIREITNDSSHSVQGQEQNMFQALYSRHQQSDSFSERLVQFLGQVPTAINETPLGIGLGQTQAGQRAVAPERQKLSRLSGKRHGLSLRSGFWACSA